MHGMKSKCMVDLSLSLSGVCMRLSFTLKPSSLMQPMLNERVSFNVVLYVSSYVD